MGISRDPLDRKVAGDAIVESAFSLQAEESSFFFTHALAQFAGGLYIAHRYVPLFPEWMIGKVVLLQVLMDLLVAPIDDGMNFDPSILQIGDR